MLKPILLAIALFTTTPAVAQTVYHEAWCPSVDPQRMIRMKRHAAQASGMLPAPDCHPSTRWRYLGLSGAGMGPGTNTERRIHVDAYMKKDGTHVSEHWRPAPGRK